jgi:hypothetical protein
VAPVAVAAVTAAASVAAMTFATVTAAVIARFAGVWAAKWWWFGGTPAAGLEIVSQRSVVRLPCPLPTLGTPGGRQRSERCSVSAFGRQLSRTSGSRRWRQCCRRGGRGQRLATKRWEAQPGWSCRHWLGYRVRGRVVDP